jgi:hypothetical protein
MQHEVEHFLSTYSEEVQLHALKLREVIIKNLPGITEQLDLPAKIIGYCYGQKYSELICVLIPSKKGLKLGFNRAASLPDPENLLEGTGKVARYVVITSAAQIRSKAVKDLIKNGYKLYQESLSAKKV